MSFDIIYLAISILAMKDFGNKSKAIRQHILNMPAEVGSPSDEAKAIWDADRSMSLNHNITKYAAAYFLVSLVYRLFQVQGGV